MEAKTLKGQTPSLISTKYHPPYCTRLGGEVRKASESVKNMFHMRLRVLECKVKNKLLLSAYLHASLRVENLKTHAPNLNIVDSKFFLSLTRKK